MPDRDEELNPLAIEEGFVDNLPETINFPPSKKARLDMATATGERVPVEILPPRLPAPVHNGTDLENHIDDDLGMVNVTIDNLTRMWKTVRTVQEAINLSTSLTNLLEKRRKLANKQLGAESKNSASGKMVYEVPD